MGHPPSPPRQKPISKYAADNPSSAYDQASEPNQARRKVISDSRCDQAPGYSSPDPEVTKETAEYHGTLMVMLFALYCSLVHRRNFQLQIGGTHVQYGKGTRAKDTEAAHISTLPSIEFRLNDVQPWRRLAAESNLGILQNTTTIAPRALNRADCLVDGTAEQPKMRQCALELLQRVTLPRGDPQALRPLRAVKLYLIRRAEILQDILASCSVKNSRFEVLEWYLELTNDWPRWRELYNLTILPSLSKAPLWMYRSLRAATMDYQFSHYLAQERINNAIKSSYPTTSKTLAAGCALQNWVKNHAKSLVRDGLPILREMFVPPTRCRANIDAETLPKSLRDLVATELEGLVQLEHTYRSLVCERILWKHGTPTDFAETLGYTASKVSRLLAYNRTPTKKEYKTPPSQRFRPITSVILKEIANAYKIDPGVFCPGVFDADSL